MGRERGALQPREEVQCGLPQQKRCQTGHVFRFATCWVPESSSGASKECQWPYGRHPGTDPVEARYPHGHPKHGHERNCAPDGDCMQVCGHWRPSRAAFVWEWSRIRAIGGGCTASSIGIAVCGAPQEAGWASYVEYILVRWKCNESRGNANSAPVKPEAVCGWCSLAHNCP